MLNLKLALLATTAVGAVTAGGIAYATVGSSTPSVPAKAKAVTDAAGNAARGATAKVPAAPTCVPSAPTAKLPKAKNHDLKNHHIVKGLQGVQGHLPKAGVPAAPGVPSALPKPPAGVPGAVPGTLPKAPANLPTCLPSAPNPGAAAAQGVTPGAPALPKLPEGKLPSCDKVPPAITTQKSIAKDVTLPNGMHLAYAHSHSITIKTHQVCENVEKFVGTAGSFITVERLQTPPQVTLQDVASALKMPQGKVVSLSGLQAWETPLGTGMVWISDQGYAMSISGSPTLAGQLPLIAEKLQHLK